MEFKGKNVLITGGTGGIGHGIAKKLLQFGVEVSKSSRFVFFFPNICFSILQNVGIFDIADKANTILSLQNEFPKNSIVFYQCDIQNRFELNFAYKKFINDFSYIDIVVNSAGIMNENRKFHKDVVLINLVNSMRNVSPAFIYTKFIAP